jgi:hypothetical protein
MKNIDFKKLIPYFVAIIVFIGFSLIYFSPVLDGKKLNQSDIVHYKGTAKEANDYKEKTGEEALWTNSMFGGMPTYQISVSNGWNPIGQLKNYIMLGIPHPANILFLLFICFFILLIVLKIDPWLSIIGALAFALSSYFFVCIDVGHNSKVIAVAFIPAVLAGVILVFRGKYFLGGALTALFLSLEIIANHIQMTYYMMFLLGIYGIAELINAIIEKKYMPFMKSIGVLLIAGIIAVGPSVSNLWTSYEYMKETIRGKSELTADQSNKSGGLDKDYITSWSYGIGETFTLMIPDVKGGESAYLGDDKDALKDVEPQYRETVAGQSKYWGEMPFTQGTVYAGAFLCFLFVLGMFIVKNRFKWVLFAATIFFFFLAWGHNMMWLSNFFIDHFPFYNKFRSVSSMMVIPEITIPLLAILALKDIFENPKLIKDKQKYFFIAFGLTAGLCLLFWLMPKTFFTFLTSAELKYRQQNNNQQINDIFANIELARIAIFKASAIRSFIFILLGAGILYIYASLKKVNKYVIYAGLALVIIIDMVPVDKRYIKEKDFVSKKQIEVPYVMTQADQTILTDKEPDFRVLNMTVGDFSADASISYYHKSIGGYHAAKLKRYKELVDARLDKERDLLAKTLSSKPTDSALLSTFYSLTSLNMLNTKYFIYNYEAPPLKNPAALGSVWFVHNTKIVNNADEEIKAMDNFSPSYTAIVDKRFENQLVAFKGGKDKDAIIKLVEYSPNRLTYEASNLKNSQLAVFSEVYYSAGWNVYVDGTKSDYFRTNYVLRGMVVPAGNHKIEFKFEPTSYFLGKKISIISSIILLLGVIGAIFYSLKKAKTDV